MKRKFIHFLLSAFAIAGLSGCHQNVQTENNATAENVVVKSKQPASNTAPSAASEHFLNEVLGLATPFIERDYIKGMVIAAVTSDGISYKAFGNLENIDDAPNTVLEIGSISKVFTSLAFASMINDGIVTADTPLSMCLPKDKSFANVEDITLGMLASHTSGLPRLQEDIKTANMDDPYNDVTLDKLWQSLATTERTPDETGSLHGQFEYSNFGGAILGQALTLCDHRNSWDDLIARRVTDIMGLNSVGVMPYASIQQGYDSNLSEHAPWHWGDGAMAPCGGLKANASSLAKFVQIAISDESSPAQDIIKTSLVPVFTPVAGTQGFDAISLNWLHGIGLLSNALFTDENAKQNMKSLVWHNGQTGAGTSFVGFLPEKKAGIVILSNTSNDSSTILGIAALGIIAGEQNAHLSSVIERMIPAPAILTRNQLQRMAGFYSDETGKDTIHIELKDDNTIWDGSNHFRLWPKDEKTLVYRIIPNLISFELPDDGSPAPAVVYVDRGRPTPLKRIQP